MLADMDWYKDAAAIVGGVTAALGAMAIALSKIARGYSSDRKAVATDSTSVDLYKLLLRENTRIDGRNQILEAKNDEMLERLNHLEAVHKQLLQTEVENRQLKVDLAKKENQLLHLLTQQRKDRADWESKITELKQQVEHLQSTVGMRHEYRMGDENNA